MVILQALGIDLVQPVNTSIDCQQSGPRQEILTSRLLQEIGRV